MVFISSVFVSLLEKEKTPGSHQQLKPWPPA
jgi:hypothetical protein